MLHPQLWIVRDAISRCLGPAFGLVLFLPPALWLLAASRSGLAPAALTALGATLGHVFATSLAPRLASPPRR